MNLNQLRHYKNASKLKKAFPNSISTLLNNTVNSVSASNSSDLNNGVSSSKDVADTVCLGTTASVSSFELGTPAVCSSQFSSLLPEPAANICKKKGRRKKVPFDQKNFDIIRQYLIRKIPIDSECRHKYSVILDSSSRRADEVERRLYKCELCQHQTSGECE